jgi:hypothetical protein
MDPELQNVVQPVKECRRKKWKWKQLQINHVVAETEPATQEAIPAVQKMHPKEHLQEVLHQQEDHHLLPAVTPVLPAAQDRIHQNLPVKLPVDAVEILQDGQALPVEAVEEKADGNMGRAHMQINRYANAAL